MNGSRTVEVYLKFLKCSWVHFNTGLRIGEEFVEFLKVHELTSIMVQEQLKENYIIETSMKSTLWKVQEKLKKIYNCKTFMKSQPCIYIPLIT